MTGAAARRRLPLVAGVAVAAISLDQLTKTWALRALDDGAVHLVWTLQLRLAFNTGASFSFGRGFTPLLTAVAGAIVAALLISARRVTTAGAATGLGLLIGGAAGNLADRLVRGHGGAVIDFIDLQWWPVFNVADICIFLGAATLVLTAGREERARAATGGRADA